MPLKFPLPRTNPVGNALLTRLLWALFLFCFQVPSLLAQPNIIFIIADDLNDSVEGMGGHSQAHTPNIERLMNKGVRFTNAHCNAPICGPSRASLWSGLLPSTTGFYGIDQQNNKWRQFDKLSDAITMMEHFKANGYLVYGSGKIFHNGHTDNTVFTIDPDTDPDGAGPYDFGPSPWDGVSYEGTSNRRTTFAHPTFTALGISGYYASFGSLEDIPTIGSYNGWSLKTTDFTYNSKNDRDLMPDEITAQWVQTKLSQTHSDPFFIIAGMSRPHAPFYAPDEFFDFFRDANGDNTVVLPPFIENDLDDVPDILKSYSKGNPYRTAGNGNDEWWKNMVQAYLACVAFVDHQVGTILDAVEASPYANNTIIVFTSDHGYHLGEKDHKSKTTAWEETTRVPLVIYAPGTTPAAQECAVPVSLVDLYPTLNALCGLPADPNGGVGKNNIALDGNDMTPLLTNPSLGQWEGPQISLSHLNSLISLTPHTQSPWALNHHSARSAEYHYVLCSDGSEELYDHTNDPNEWTNQASNSAYASSKENLKLRLFRALGFKNAQSLVSNGNFESGTTNWSSFGPTALGNNTSNKLEGSQSILVSNRTSGTWNGLRQNMLGVLEPGKTYHLSAWVKLESANTDVVRLNIKQVIGANPTDYITVGTDSAVTNSAFSLLEGDFTVPESDSINELEITVNGPAVGVNFYLDHVQAYQYQEPFIVASLILDNDDGSHTVNWNAELGVSYRLEESNDLSSSWTIIQSDITADKTRMSSIITEQPGVSQRFWRVIKN